MYHVNLIILPYHRHHLFYKGGFPDKPGLATYPTGDLPKPVSEGNLWLQMARYFTGQMPFLWPNKQYQSTQNSKVTFVQYTRNKAIVDSILPPDVQFKGLQLNTD